MPHSTIFATTPKSNPLQPLNSSISSPKFPVSIKSLKPPTAHPPQTSSPLPARKQQQYEQSQPHHFLLMTRGISHGRSKSTSAAMSAMSCPDITIPAPASTSRLRGYDQPPPLLRMPNLSPIISDRKKPHPTWLTMTPHTPTTPPATHRNVFLGGMPRSASPTRIYTGTTFTPTRLGYYPNSLVASPRAPSPPSHLVNEAMYPISSASSSSPSTPSSIRSRSPSISSLETIPDTPDAEQEAVEAELREAMERKSVQTVENEDEEDGAMNRRRRSLDFERGSLRWSGADKRKRWSVCGGEKRGDLDLETIWEEALSSVDNTTSLRNTDYMEEEEEEGEEDNDEEAVFEEREEEEEEGGEDNDEEAVFEEREEEEDIEEEGEADEEADGNNYIHVDDVIPQTGKTSNHHI